MKLTIDRNIWLRGEPANSCLLRTEDGKKCCVGIFLSALGVEDEKIREINTAWSAYIIHSDERIPDWTNNRNILIEDDISQLYYTNDSLMIGENDREEAITKLFAKHDVEVEFIN